MTKRNRFMVLSLGLMACLGFQTDRKPRFGELRGEVTKEFAKAVAMSPGAFFNHFVYESYLPFVDFEKGLKNAVRMVEKGAVRMGMSLFDPCEPVFEGESKDADGDRLPAKKGTFHIECVSGDEKLSAKVEVGDLDDTKRPVAGGVEVYLKTAKGQVYNKLKHVVAFESDTSEFVFKPTKEKSEATGSAIAKASIAVTGSKLDVGFEGSGDFTGDIEERKIGDTAKAIGIAKYAGTKLTGFPDADFVAKANGEVTFGMCPESDLPMVKSGQGTLEDSKGNKIVFTVKDCIGSVTYNGEKMQINAKDQLRLPGGAY